ncbi:hypothetical protein HZB94_00900 [Candidatus Falkowbacteria bacterium]|nr:hypothetical protein [Candidatus Falkowbacteria bacterium]
MLRRNILLIILIAFVALGTTGCIKITKQKTATSKLGGVFYTTDRFETWKHRSYLMTPGETPGSIADIDVYFMRFDPSDSEAIYMGTRADGLYYSYNGGAGWNKSEKLPAGFVRDVVIDPKDKCTLYAAVESKVYKSEDCARTWKEVYYTDNAERKITALGVDWYIPDIIWVGLSDGTVLQSGNKGLAWKKIGYFGNRVQKIIVDPNDSRIIYFGVLEMGLWRTTDKGVTWEDLNKAMKDFQGAKVFSDFALGTSSKNVVVYANKYGLLRSLDGGATWSELKLLTLPAGEQIYSVAIDSTNANYIYYSTDTAVYKSVDGGENWVVKKTPTTRVVSALLVHPKQTATIFAGVKEVEQ